MEGMRSLKGRQIKAARALVDWSQQDLATASGLSNATIRKLEMGHISPRGKTSSSLRHAFENAGLEFLEPDGVRHRPEDIRIYQGADGARDFYDDVYADAAAKGGEAVIIHPSAKKYFVDMLGSYAKLHIERMQALKAHISVKCLICEDTDILPAHSYCDYRQISKSYVAVAPSYVYGTKYALIILEAVPSPKIIVIDSRAVAEALRQQFYSLWDKGVPLNAQSAKRDVARRK